MKRLIALVFALATGWVLCACADQPRTATAAEQLAAGLVASTSQSADPETDVTRERILNIDTVALSEGQTHALADDLPDGISFETGEYTFTSSDASIADVDDAGIVTAKAPGSATILVSTQDLTDSLQIEVKGISSMDIQPDYVALSPGGSSTASIAVKHVEGDVEWSSSDESVATVDANGHIRAQGEGAARISAKAGDEEDSIGVWVTQAEQLAPLADIQPSRYAMQDGVLTQESAVDTGKATIMLTGDLMALSSQQNAAESGDTFDYNNSFCLVQPILADSDFTLGNLETCLSYSNPYTLQEKEVEGNPHANAQATYAEALRYAGFDAVGTANNHCGDAGTMGVYETVQTLDTYGIAHTGTFTRQDQPRYMLVDIHGIRIAILAYTDSINPKTGDLQVPLTLQSTVFNEYTSEKAQQDIAAARAAGAEYVIVYMHWGTQHEPEASATQTQQAQELANAGADFIAGSHPHCLQPAAILTAADGRTVPCVYSLGNFISGMARDTSNDTVIVKLVLARTDDGVELRGAGYIPCHVYSEYEGENHVIIPTSPALNGGVDTASLSEARDRIVEILGNDVLLEIAG